MIHLLYLVHEVGFKLQLVEGCAVLALLRCPVGGAVRLVCGVRLEDKRAAPMPTSPQAPTSMHTGDGESLRRYRMWLPLSHTEATPGGLLSCCGWALCSGGFGMRGNLLTCMRWAVGVLVRRPGGATGHAGCVLVTHTAATSGCE